MDAATVTLLLGKVGPGAFFLFTLLGVAVLGLIWNEMKGPPPPKTPPAGH